MTHWSSWAVSSYIFYLILHVFLNFFSHWVSRNQLIWNLWMCRQHSPRFLSMMTHWAHSRTVKLWIIRCVVSHFTELWLLEGWTGQLKNMEIKVGCTVVLMAFVCVFKYLTVHPGLTMSSLESKCFGEKVSLWYIHYSVLKRAETKNAMLVMMSWLM